MSVKNRNSIVTDGLVLYVDAANENSYPGTGTTWTGLVGSKNGTLTNGPTYSSANGGNIVFDGVDDYVDFGNTGLRLECMNFWFYLNSEVTSNTTAFGLILCDILSAQNQQNGCAFGSITGYVTNETFTMLDGATNAYGRTSITDNIPAGWNNLVTNWNGSSYDIWLNNSKRTTTSGTAQAGHFDLKSNSQILRLGYSYDNGAAKFNGKLAVFSAYNSSLTDQEITQNYNALKNRFV